MNTCRCGCGRTCRGAYARGHNPSSHEKTTDRAPSQLLVLQAINGRRTRQEIADELGRSARYVGTVLTRLKDKGQVRCTRRGVWETTT